LNVAGAAPRRYVLDDRGQSQRDIARRTNARPAARLVVAAFENPVQFVGADAALVQQRNGGTEVGRGQKAIGHRRDSASGLFGNVFNELRSNVRDFSELALINNTNYFAANIEARAGFTCRF